MSVNLEMHPAIASIEDRRKSGGGVVVALKEGFRFSDAPRERTRHAPTMSEARRLVAAYAVAKPKLGRRPSAAPVGDTTSAARAKNYLARLERSAGKRLVVDLTGEARAALDRLVFDGYGSSQKDVVNKALLSASEKFTK